MKEDDPHFEDEDNLAKPRHEDEFDDNLARSRTVENDRAISVTDDDNRADSERNQDDNRAGSDRDVTNRASSIRN